MTTSTVHFRGLHRPGHPLLLPNAWDTGSARIFASLGAQAIATTSAGVSWAAGVPDGGALDASAHLQLARQLTSAVAVPVSLDVEDGCSTSHRDVAALVTELAAAGVAGVNLEDSTAGAQRDVADFAGLLRAVRARLEAAGLDVFLNARVDTYLLGTSEPDDATLARARAYVDAGADGVFLPGLADLPTIASLCRRLPAPVNVMVPAGRHTVADLAAAGVARISTGAWLAQVAHGAAMAAARHLLDHGGCAEQPDAADYGDLNSRMATPLALG